MIYEGLSEEAEALAMRLNCAPRVIFRIQLHWSVKKKITASNLSQAAMDELFKENAEAPKDLAFDAVSPDEMPRRCPRLDRW